VGDAQVDLVEDEVVAEALADALELDHRSPVGRGGLLVSYGHAASIKRDGSLQVKALTATGSPRTLAGFRRRAKGEMS
jgi:hypothetical protein